MARWSTATVIRTAAVALLTCSLQAGLAQRGGGHAGGHGGFAAHGAPHMASRSFGGFRSAVPRSAAPRPAMRPSFAASRGEFAGRANGLDHSRFPYRSAIHARSTQSRAQYSPDRYRRPYRGGYRHPYLEAAWSVWPNWTVPYYLGYPDDYGFYNDQTPQAQPDQEDAYAEAPYASEAEPWPSYPPEQPSTAKPTPAPQDSVTLIFKDGRQPERIQNYMMTGSTLYVLDQKRREIPIKDLDLNATASANRDAGVDFQLPAGTP